MAEQGTFDASQPEALSDRLAALRARWLRVAALLFERAIAEDDPGFAIPAPEVVGETLEALAQALLREPDRFAAAILDWHARFAALMNRQLARRADPKLEPLYKPEASDRRFVDAEWSEDLRFDTLKQVYLMTCAWMHELVQSVAGLDAKTRMRASFYVRLALEALAPTNYPATNPVVLRAAIESRGATLLRGLERLLEDLERNHGRLPVAPGRTDSFALGRDLATTPGAVMFRTDLAELIQYAPTTETVFARPVLIVPPGSTNIIFWICGRATA